MLANLIGYRKVDFISKDDKPVKGTKIFLVHPENGVSGFTCSGFFVDIRNDDFISIDLDKFLGKEVDIELDFKGKLVCLSA